MDRKNVLDLAKSIDPHMQLDDDVEEILLQLLEKFIEDVVKGAAEFACHRKSTSLDQRDIQIELERKWNIWIPGFGTDELKSYKKPLPNESHKQRMALIKKTVKKY